MARTLAFRIPKRVLKPPQALVTSDRASTLPSLLEICTEKNPNVPEVAPPNVYRVLEAFNKPSTSLLDIPRELKATPYEYFTTVNSGDGTYTTEPRLSVTRLLTDAWCELEQFYRIYSGSHKKEVTLRIAEGTTYHNKLEDEEHELVNVQKELSQLEAIAASHSPEDVAYLGRNYDGALWSKRVEKTVTRGIALAQTRHARELNLHAFVDLERGRFVSDVEDLDKAVLVSGMADVVSITKRTEELDVDGGTEEGKILPRKADAVDNPQESVSSEDLITRELRDVSLFMPLWDLSQLIPHYQQEYQKEAGSLLLEVTDVKTRGAMNIPRVKSQLKSAKVQCMYYTRFIHDMARDATHTYASYLQNATRRLVDPDLSIGESHATIILLENFEAVVFDFLRLARGEPLGFDVHDDFISKQFADADATLALNYNLSRFISEKDFKEIIEDVYGDTISSQKLDLSPLFRPWRYPLTSRYFMARAAQTLHIFEPLHSSTVKVEYHHAKSGTVIGLKEYGYSDKEIEAEFRRSAQFWAGQRRPKGADIKFKCNNCEFNSRCPTLVKPNRESIGELIYHDLLA